MYELTVFGTKQTCVQILTHSLFSSVLLKVGNNDDNNNN